MRLESVGVIGGGAWGTALAQTLRLAGRDVLIWARETEVVNDINERHVNAAFLPGVELDSALRATSDLSEIARADAILMVAPAQHVRTVATGLKPHLKPGQPVVNCAKGIERTTGNRIYLLCESEHVYRVCKFLFDDLKLRFVISTGVDAEHCFEVLHHFANDESGCFVTVKAFIRDRAAPALESITPLIPGAEWIEREMHDILGITFKNHPNLRRLILNDDC